ncbi:MAG: TRAP transporter large permease subunit [Desulfobacterales bacterium]|nr:MAG: TRAP transporter large permease subunit [Desulfobacterales bacterium]
MTVSIGFLSIFLALGIIALLIIGLPLAFATGSIATVATLFLFGPDAMQLEVMRVFDMMNNYVLVAVPLFIFMANMMERAGVAEQLYSAVHIWSGRMPGGLAIGTIVACCLMAAMVGIVGAEVVTLGLIAVPTMLKRGYHKNIALGSVCAGGGLSTLIPPSVVFIVYAMAAGVSVGELFIAGIGPGLLLAALYIAYIVIRTGINPSLAPPAPEEEQNLSIREKARYLKGLILPMLIAFGVLGSIYAGVATPTEAAGVGCLGATVACLINGNLNVAAVKTVLFGTLKVSAMCYWLMFGAQCIIGIYNMAGGAEFVRSIFAALPLGPYGIIVVMQLILIFLGCFIDFIGILLLTMPLFVPIIVELGFDPIWFGVLFCMNMQVSYISPPFGPSAFYLKGVLPPDSDVTVTDIFRSTVPYMFLILIALLIIMFVPEVALFLPRMIRS